MAELDVNEGVVPLIEMRFPEKGTLLTPDRANFTENPTRIRRLISPPSPHYRSANNTLIRFKTTIDLTLLITTLQFRV
jgi:hypothetical protein